MPEVQCILDPETAMVVKQQLQYMPLIPIFKNRITQLSLILFMSGGLGLESTGKCGNRQQLSLG